MVEQTRQIRLGVGGVAVCSKDSKAVLIVDEALASQVLSAEPGILEWFWYFDHEGKRYRIDARFVEVVRWFPIVLLQEKESHP